jgi:2,3-dihydroxyphenylpropionate 1,2-dioxygenase
MGEIVAAVGACHAPQLITRPPDEKPEQLDASIAAMRQMGKILDETKPDVIIIFGSDHLETFSMTCVPTFAIVAGNRAIAKFGGSNFDLPINREMAEDLLGKLVHGGFDLAYSEDGELGHTFATPFKYILEGRDIPVIPFFINVYLPPLPTARRCAALGRAIAEAVKTRPEKVCVIASGGMSHYPGTSKYDTPEFDFDRWMISQLEIGNMDALLNMSPSQLDEVGNTEMLQWACMFGAIGAVPGELLQYTPTWHHGHGYMRFLPRRERQTPIMQVAKEYGGFQFKNKGFEFYKHPPAEAYHLNKLLFEMRTDAALRQRIIDDQKGIAREYELEGKQAAAIQALIDVGNAKVVSDYVKPLSDAGAHPLGALMALHVIFSMNHKAKQMQPAAERKN